MLCHVWFRSLSFLHVVVSVLTFMLEFNCTGAEKLSGKRAGRGTGRRKGRSGGAGKICKKIEPPTAYRAPLRIRSPPQRLNTPDGVPLRIVSPPNALMAGGALRLTPALRLLTVSPVYIELGQGRAAASAARQSGNVLETK